MGRMKRSTTKALLEEERSEGVPRAMRNLLYSQPYREFVRSASAVLEELG